MSVTSDNFAQNSLWLLKEFAKIFQNPLGVIGGGLDAIRGWKFSRNWLSIWINLPAFALVASAMSLVGISFLKTREGQVQEFHVASENRCSTGTLEAACNQLQEEKFAKLLGNQEMYQTREAQGGIVIAPLTKRYVDLIGKQILSVEPGNPNANYRNALLMLLDGDSAGAKEAMKRVADQNDAFPQASAWFAKSLLLDASSEETAGSINVKGLAELNEIAKYLDKAISWRNVDYRLMLLYARLLEMSNDVSKAIAITKKAAAVKPEANLDLARLYAKIGNEEGLRDSAFFVENAFQPRLNSTQERDLDRLAIAEVRKLQGKHEQAAEVLAEGLARNQSRALLRKELSSIQRAAYSKTIVRGSDGKFTADIGLLEKAAETDPTNPEISVEIARLLPMKLKPSKQLMDILKKQVSDEVVTVQTYMLLAEGFLSLGSPDKSIRYWEMVLKQEPTNAAALNNLSLTLAKTDPTQINRAIQLSNQAVAVAPGNPEFLDTLGEILLLAKRYNEAINKFELAVRLDKNRVNTRQKLVDAYKDAGLEAEARSQMEIIKRIQEAAAAQEKDEAMPEVSK
jgi:tetratricopeptide (TPR) repeat protein